ncbi:MAG: hypothetical protein AABX40_06260 [Candidatus Hydrothermarchaeota archaeon]|mgnify:FL=1
MMRVETFTQKLEIFKTINQLKELDEKVNQFLAGKDVVSVSDTTTTNEKGATMGIIRVVTYKEED